jgi:hypothetical protein
MVSLGRPAIGSDCAAEAELWEIAENLHRAELSKLERARSQVLGSSRLKNKAIVYRERSERPRESDSYLGLLCHGVCV